ncbi:MAG TPA: YfhO family protein, partial [Ferruginibacter sp.]|nr:YfhO family protein [Ferruginibacter sp.]
TAGHVTQMLALGYAPAVLGAAILVYEKKYITGFTLMALLTALQIQQGHQQVTYYLFLVLGAMSIAYIIHFIKTKQTTHLLKSIGLLLVAGLIGVASNAINLLPVYDFAKESKRGGQLVIGEGDKSEKISNGKTTGLSKGYAFQWSYGKAETLSLMFPGVLSYGSHYAERDGENYLFPKLDENSNTAKFLVEKLNIPEESATNFALSKSMDLYWGDQPFTNGPVYLGAVICLLFIFGIFYLDGKHKWWILAMTALAILMSWGRNLPGFNYFLFDYLPFYNKFRVPTMSLVIVQLLVPILAALAIDKLLANNDPATWKKFRYAIITTGIVFLLAISFYFSSDFSRENKQRTTHFNQLYNASDPAMESKMAGLNIYPPEKDNRLYEEMIFTMKGSGEAQKNAREFVTAIRKDRASILMKDILRSLVFVLIAAGLIALYIRKKINSTVLIAGVTLISMIDLLGFGMKYLNDKSFDSKDKYEENEFPMTAADRSILADKDPNFRVFNLAGGDPFQESKTSYYHKSIGGYHPAKLGIYDDLSAYQLSGQPNISVLNMLNTKYVLQQNGNEVVASLNPGALGNAWFVKAVKYVNGPVEEMKALSGFNPKDTVIADQQYKAMIGSFSPADSTSSITMKTFDNDAITYESSAASDHIAVFSEIYYKDWKATIDGKPADIFKANYVLRALKVPSGKHVIEFKFEPAIFYTGKTISNISAWLIILLLAGFIVYTVRKENKNG